MSLSRRRFALLAGAAASSVAAPAVLRTPAWAQAGSAARNVILMISDGAGFHTWNAAAYFADGQLGSRPYDRLPVRTLMTSFPLNTSRQPTADPAPQVGYDAAAAWSVEPGGEAVVGNVTRRTYTTPFAGYHYVRQDFADSAAAGTALAAGIKTFNNAINVDNDGRPVRMVSEYAKSAGKAVGVVSSVQLSHATPAAFAAHNVSRQDYTGIAQEMIEGGLCDVMMGCGHPYFDNDGRPRDPADNRAFRFLGGPDSYAKAAAGETAYQWIERKADFDALAQGALVRTQPKLMGVAQVASTLQYARSGSDMDRTNANVPDLATMSRGALQVLGGHEAGFFLMIEGGAVDWAAHGNATARLIQEQLDFDRAVGAVVAWIEAHGGFEETLLIVTTDHGNGILYGPDSDRIAFQPVRNRGRGVLPDVRWHFDDHTNELVPVWAGGPGAERLVAASVDSDPHTGLVGWGDVQRYHDNTDVARVMVEALTGRAASAAG